LRPLTLHLQGIRSYREQRTIDFQGRGLVAIVGDTGAGKSSILEAITYALYNATTWDQRAVTQLISDGAQSMSVELTFQAGDQIWQVQRACHRSSSRPSTHRLRCLSQPSSEEFDGELAVNRQVERLLGMTYKAYLAAVVLPQGRFQTLLQETRARRTEILEGIFRLTDLRSVRLAARDLGQRAEVAVERLLARRGALLPDPSAEAARLRQTLQAVEAREKAMLQLLKLVKRSEDADRRASEKANALRQARDRLAQLDPAAWRSLADLVPLAAQLQEQLAVATAQEAELASSERAAGAAAAESARRREGVEDMTAAMQLLDSSRQTLADLETAQEAARREQVEVTEEAVALERAGEALVALERAWQECKQSADSAAQALESQQGLARRAGDRLKAAREAGAARDQARLEEGRREQALPGLRERLIELQKACREAEIRLAEHRLALDQRRRQDAAAHAAEGLHPGDSCPICRSELGPDFEPPHLPALAPVERALAEAEREFTRRRDAEVMGRAQIEEAERRLQEARERHQAVEQALAAGLLALGEVVLDADLEFEDQVLLGPISERTAALLGQSRDRAEQVNRAWGELQAAQADLSAREGWLKQRRRRLEQELSAIQSRRERCDLQLRSLPPALTIGGAHVPGDLDSPIAEARRRLEAALTKRRELDRLREELAAVAEGRLGLERQLQEEVEAPRQRALRAAAELRVRLNDAHQALDRQAIETVSADRALEAQSRWVAEMGAMADELIRQLEQEVGEIEVRIQAQAAELASELARSGLGDVPGLERELRQVDREQGQVKGQLDRAEAQVVQATALDAQVARGNEVRDSLSELQRLLQDGQFIGHVIERRQRQLLLVASEILGSVTGNRYGFSLEFDIVDRLSNQPRTPRTLSGGETFLASLALALALVEIAARSGTRLDALFLDEGFGSLDANALDEAISALERRASEGRLVAVVSHVRAVAERLETVLEVSRTPSGSRADWRGPGEREQMLAQELEAGLLA
jgi:exonuclease SbcC